MEGLDDLLGALEGRMGLSSRQKAFIQQQERNAAALAQKIASKKQETDKLKEALLVTYQPDGRGSFLEVGEFDGYNALQFFYTLGSFLDRAFSPSLERVGMVDRIAGRTLSGFGQEMSVLDLKDKMQVLAKVTEETLEVLMKGVMPFEDMVKHAYQRAIDQYRYLQKRFLNIGVDDSRVYRAPWEQEDQHGFDLNRVPYVKIELVRNNPLLTDLLLDVANSLPKRYTRKEKVAGKRKPKEVKYLDDFEVERAARVLVELSNTTYQGYIKDPRSYLTRVAQSVSAYYDIFSSLESSLRNIIDGEGNNPRRVFEVAGRDFNRPMVNPAPLMGRLQGINYLGITPNEEDTKPSSQMERNYFAARRRLLEHLADSIDAITRATSFPKKYELARAAAEQGVKLKENVNKVMETRRSVSLKKDKRADNEFYVGTSGAFGEFKFEREPAPKVRLRDVYGKSFDEMKRHLEDLADYSKYLQLYGATAPRGKIRSNIIAIGPYGCGKTEIGRAIAGDPRFIGADVTVTDLLTCWFGEFEKNVDRVWDAAKELRANSGDSKLVFLLMDEFDSWFGSSNGHWVDHTYRRVQKAIQMKLDGVVDYEGIIAVGFTNEPSRVPLAIYRRFKYVDIVGELDGSERVALLKHFLTSGLPLSSGFRETDYSRWGSMLDGATGDVIGKVVDDLHYEFMRKFVEEHPTEGRKLNNYIRRKTQNGDSLDKPYVKRTIGEYMRVTPDWVEQKVQAKLADPIIVEQIETAKRVYAEARQVLANLHRRQDDASGCVSPGSEHPGTNYRQRQGTNLE